MFRVIPLPVCAAAERPLPILGLCAIDIPNLANRPMHRYFIGTTLDPLVYNQHVLLATVTGTHRSLNEMKTWDR